jgi:hypothetical protein
LEDPHAGYLLFGVGPCIDRRRRDMPDTYPLNQRQIRCLEKLPADHELVASDDGPPVVRGPKGEWLRIKENGRLVPLVERVQSYLNVRG